MVPLRIVTDADIETGRFGPERAGIPPLAEPGPAERNRLDGLRIVKRLLRLSSRRDPFIAFAVYTTSSPAAQEAAELGDEPYGILMHALDLVLRRPPEFWGPGDSEITFDEAWLLGLFLAVERGDEDSLNFLVRSRVVPPACGLITALVLSVSEIRARYHV